MKADAKFNGDVIDKRIDPVLLSITDQGEHDYLLYNIILLNV